MRRTDLPSLTPYPTEALVKNSQNALTTPYAYIDRPYWSDVSTQTFPPTTSSRNPEQQAKMITRKVKFDWRKRIKLKLTALLWYHLSISPTSHKSILSVSSTMLAIHITALPCPINPPHRTQHHFIYSYNKQSSLPHPYLKNVCGDYAMQSKGKASRN